MNASKIFLSGLHEAGHEIMNSYCELNTSIDVSTENSSLYVIVEVLFQIQLLKYT